MLSNTSHTSFSTLNLTILISQVLETIVMNNSGNDDRAHRGGTEMNASVFFPFGRNGRDWSEVCSSPRCLIFLVTFFLYVRY